MKVLCILLCIAFASGFYIDKNETRGDKIVGGAYVRIEDVPYQASVLWFRRNYKCGATIIHESWVITAAHCVNNRAHISVRTGSGYRRMFGKEHRVEKIIMHADFETNRKHDDIALIKVAKPIQFNNETQPVEIAKPNDIPREHELMRISGFGLKGLHLEESDILKAAYVPVINQENCQRAYRSQSIPITITDELFCAGNGEANACYGDSGGPGVIRGKLYGIIAFGTNCNSTIFPEVFTRVHKYHNWIEEKTELRF